LYFEVHGRFPPYESNENTPNPVFPDYDDENPNFEEGPTILQNQT
jgi:hypothetical protein